jgi:hypothetical protein
MRDMEEVASAARGLEVELSQTAVKADDDNVESLSGVT